MKKGKKVAADELRREYKRTDFRVLVRGKYIEGGETRRLVPGDVIIIPNLVPHWFKEVSSPFNYYVVKVR